jgi:hypothetical protein
LPSVGANDKKKKKKDLWPMLSDLPSWSNCELKTSYIAEDGKSGTFVIGNDHFPASLLDLPCVVESYKTYDDSVLIKTADVGQVKCSLALSLLK